MTLIIGYPSPAPLVAMTGGVVVSADGAAIAGLAVRMINGTSIAANGNMISPGAVALIGSTTISARGRLGSEPNIFGSVSMIGSTTIGGNSAPIVAGKVNLSTGTTISAAGRIAAADKSTLTLIVNVIPNPNAGFGDTISARITADGVVYPIRAFNYDEPRNAAGQTLELTLQRPGDRAAIIAAGSFKFEIYTAGIWIELFNSGIRSSTGYSFAYAEARPNDALSVSTIGPISAKLNKSPLENLTVYDSARETIRAADFRVIYDTEGGSHAQELHPIAGLLLYDLLQYVLVTKCEFAGFVTDIPNYPIRRADFSKTGTFLDGIAPHIGAFKPLIFIRGGNVWILDSTEKIPAGFAAPLALNANNYKSANLNSAELNADGFVVTFADSELDFDYTTDREVVDDTDIIGVYGSPNYQQIRRKRTFRDYYKISNPLIPVRTDKINETETLEALVNGTLLTVNETIENVSIDSFGRLATIRKDVTGLVPDIRAVGFPAIQKTLSLEKTAFNYIPDLMIPRRQILGKTVKEISGLVLSDPVNEHVGKPFKQTFIDAYRAGNLRSDELLVIAFEPIQTVIETNTQNAKGQTETRTRTTDFLTNPPTVINATTDARAGDASTNGASSAQNTIIVLRAGHVRTDGRLLDLQVGELPLKYATPLARRMLANVRQATGSVVLTGLNLAFQRGTVFELFDRDGFSIGSFIVEGRSIAGSGLGTAGQATAQTLQVTEI